LALVDPVGIRLSHGPVGCDLIAHEDYFCAGTAVAAEVEENASSRRDVSTANCACLTAHAYSLCTASGQL
jgi:hypothetical protein